MTFIIVGQATLYFPADWVEKTSGEKSVKRGNRLKPRKSTSWHRRKKKEAQHHQSKHRLGVRLCLFLRLCGSRHTFAQTRFGQWCSDGQNRFYGKIL